MSGPNLNRALTLEGPVTVPDGAGGYAKSWTALGTLWAEVLTGSGRDTAGEDLTLSTVPYRIIVRAAPFGAPSRPVPQQRFREGPRIFRILAVGEKDGDARHLICFAREEAPT
jgi:head-tail adaptor